MIHNFKQKNQDNILANDAYEVYAYNTETYDRFYKAYDNNLALSHWNEIKSKYGDRLDEIWDKLEAYDSDALPQQHAESVLTVAGKAYIAQEKGLNEQCIDLMLEKFSYSNRDCDWFVQRSNDDSFEKQSSVNLNHNKTQIIIPSGLISGSKAGKYGSYAEVSVPLGNTFGKMTISDALVERNGRVTTLSLPDRNRNVSVYNKDTHSYNIVEYSVAELKELYDKNWEKLNSRNKNLDSKFESNQLNVYESPQYE